MTVNLGKVAYEAYCKSVGGRSAISGEELPTWIDQKDEIKVAWDAAALAVVNADYAEEL